MRAGKPVSSVVAALVLATLPAAADPVLRVRDVELRADFDLARGIDPKSLIAFAPGVRLTEPAVRRTLSNLHATGLVAQAEVLTRPAPAPAGEPEGAARWVTAVVVARGNVRVEEVRIIGELGVGEPALRRVLPQQPGATLSEELLLHGRDEIRKVLAERGYREAQVELATQERGRRATVTYRVRSGPRSLFGAIAFEGDTGSVDAARLREVLRSRSGAPYDRERLEADRERLRSWWVERGYPAATVGATLESYDAGEHRIDVTFPIAAGPAIEVEVVGASRRRLERLGLLAFLQTENLDPQLISQSCDRIESRLQRRGHFRAQAEYFLEEVDVVDGRELGTRGGQRLTIEVDPGPKYVLREIRFEGNEQIPERDLEQLLLNTSVREPLDPGSGRLVTVDLEEDLANIRSYYLLQGFSAVEVGPALIYEDAGDLRLVIPIREGPRQRVVDLTLLGNREIAEEEIRARLPLASGGPFHPVLLEDTVNVLRALYEEQGYGAASVTAGLDWNDELTLVDVELTIYEGPRFLVDRVILRGYHTTRLDVLRRFVGLEPGEPISRRRLLEVERDLYRLGVFSRVDVELAPASESDDRRDVVVRVEEGQRRRVTYGLSYHSDDGIGGLLGVSRANIGGRGDRLQLDLRGSANDRRFRLIYDQPSFWKTRVPITYSLFQQEEERESFTVEDLGAQVSLIKDFPTLRAGLVFEYRQVELSEETVDPTEIERENRELDISSLTPNFFIDRRDDPLDATRGWSSSMQLEYAVPVLGSEADFLKLFWQQTAYQPLGRFGLLAGSVRFGAIEPFGDVIADPTVPEGLPSALVPVSERFFAGGRTTHRAFERDQLGIVGETLLERGNDDFLELGGNGLFVMNLDYRFPIAGDLGGTLLLDIGNVWADWRDLDADDLEAGAGVGLRYRSPIGPVRVEIGWKLSETFDKNRTVFFLSFGNPF